MKKLLWVKFGWSDYYRGGPVDGNFGWLKVNRGKKKEDRGHEAFNFKPIDGTYYCYVPPQTNGYAPSSDHPDGWTVVCLAKHPKRKGIHIVGWYENASLKGTWLNPFADRPERFDDSVGENNRIYCISSDSAFFVPPESRNNPFSDPSVRQGKYSFLSGPGIVTSANKDRVRGLIELRLHTLQSIVFANPDEARLPDPAVDSADPLKGFGTVDHRRNVERAAERAVIAHFSAKGFRAERVTNIPCGHDFIFTNAGTTVHVEVKGTASKTPQFFLTRNEFNKGCMANPKWQLAMVTSALAAKPIVTLYSPPQLRDAFEMEPYVYLGRFLPEPNDA